jgi:small GTP-binding protein
MALFNYTAKEITLKVVYYGPGFSGKTTNLQFLHSILPSTSRGKLISLTTEADRTLFFDFLPVDLGKIKDFNIRFQLYTVPGQVRYNATRRLVLKGADAVVFVADSQREMVDQNMESLNNMKENLEVNNINPDDIPVVFQYNKRDIKDIKSVDELNKDMNPGNSPFFEASAIEGKGVRETFQEVTDYLIKHIAEKHKVDIEAPSDILPSDAEEPVIEHTSYKEQPVPSQKETKPVEPSILLSPDPKAAVSDSTVKTKTPEIQRPPVRPEVQRPSVRPEVQRPPVRKESPVLQRPLVREEKPVVQVPPPDLSEIVSSIGDLSDVLSEINNVLKEMMKKHTKISNELFELRQIFLEVKDKKGFRKLFK